MRRESNRANILFKIKNQKFPDQKGGAEKKKFYYQPFKDLVTSISKDPLDEQKQKLDKAIMDWMGGIEQVDDILVMGIRFS